MKLDNLKALEVVLAEDIRFQLAKKAGFKFHSKQVSEFTQPKYGFSIPDGKTGDVTKTTECIFIRPEDLITNLWVYWGTQTSDWQDLIQQRKRDPEIKNVFDGIALTFKDRFLEYPLQKQINLIKETPQYQNISESIQSIHSTEHDTINLRQDEPSRPQVLRRLRP